MSYAITIIEGRLGRDPEMRYTQSGTPVTSFSVAVDRPGKDAGTEWYAVVAWEKLGEQCNQSLAKGSRCLIQGSLWTREFDAKDGTRQKRTELKAQTVQFLDPRPASGAPTVAAESFDDELPL